MTFLILATLFDSLYAILAGKVRGYFERRNFHRLQQGISGILLIGAGTWLSLTRKG